MDQGLYKGQSHARHVTHPLHYLFNLYLVFKSSILVFFSYHTVVCFEEALKYLYICLPISCYHPNEPFLKTDTSSIAYSIISYLRF